MCDASKIPVQDPPARPGEAPAAILCGQGLACQRGVRLLFDKLDFELRAGHALVVVGRNGAGKSSLLRIVAGLLAATSGRVTLREGESDGSFAEQTHYLGHDDALKAALSVADNLSFWRTMLGATGLPVEDALDEVGLGGLGRLPAAVLSAGQKRRLAIARLLVSRRRLWILDEPTTALDVNAQARFAALGRDHLDSGGLILAATHAPLDFGPRVDTLQLGARP
ncbi:heme ABC exporter ATP-binding protein CcmA [Xanthobacter sp. DSM 24535]|uniref:heme ABC exporter ATP-binding protein CcmA n=1 Tax=Roseixanthobacter psychrophilus TaxID=3119917 RepID=UPI0037294558